MSPKAEEEKGPPRVRRPKDKEELVERLRSGSGGAFAEIRDVILFAAVVGFSQKRREPFESASVNPIRWDTFINRYFAEDLVRLIAVAESDDKEIASATRLKDQLKIFEEYANGGLAHIGERLDRLKVEEPLDAILELFDVVAGDARGVDALITLAEAPDFT